MWHPEPAVRHSIPETRWPTALEAARSMLFRPARVGPLTLESRTWVPAMVPWRATEDGRVTRENLEWYGRFAAGRPGAIVVEATGIRDIPSGPLLRIGHDRFIPGLSKLVETVRRESGGHTRLFIQIIDFLTVKRRPAKEKYFARFFKLKRRHRDALAHLMQNDKWIDEDDEAVRARAGHDYTVGVRFLGDEVIEGGSHLEDAVYFGVEFARAGFDYLSVSKGGKFDDAKQPKQGHAVYPYTGRSGYECMPTVLSDERGPFGRNVPLAAAIKRAVNGAGFVTPVITSGGIATFEQAEQILQSGEADIIAAARQSLADPDWFLKARLGRGDEIRRCVFTNYCEGLDQMHKQVTCKLWDRVSLDESGITMSDDGRRRLVPPRWNGLSKTD